MARKLKKRAPQNISAGLYLESQGAINFGPLFFSEVIHRVEALYNSRKATFVFQTVVNLPINQMTDLKIPATRIATQNIQTKIPVAIRSSKNSFKNATEEFSKKQQSAMAPSNEKISKKTVE